MSGKSLGCLAVSTLILAAGVGAPALAAGSTYRIVARTGQAAPGGGGGTFMQFGAPVISANGRVAFRATTSGVLANSGVWSEGIAGMNNLQPVMRLGDAIPGFVGTFAGAFAPNVADLVLNSEGELAFAATITGTQATFGTQAILVHTEGGVASAAMPGQLVPLPCGGFGCQRWLTQILPIQFAFNASGQVAFISLIDGTGVNESNNSVLVRAGVGGTHVLIREGDAPPGTFGVTYTYLNTDARPHLNDNGEALLRNVLWNDDTSDAYWSLWRGQPGAMSLVTAETWTAPTGGTFAGVYIPDESAGFNNAGQIVFDQGVVDGAGAHMGTWLHSEGTTQAICFDGVGAPAGLTFAGPSTQTASINSDGDISFVGYLEGPGVNDDNRRALLRRSAAGTTSILARDTNQAPGFLNGVTFRALGWFGTHMLNDGRVVFPAALEGPGIHELNDESVWITRHGGQPAILMREGQNMVVGGQLRTVDNFYVAISPGVESGHANGVSDLGQVVFHVTFTDESEAIIVATPESVCAGDSNADGLVNFEDLNAILSEFGHVGDVVIGDLDLDGDVDFTDLNTVLSNFGLQCAL